MSRAVLWILVLLLLPAGCTRRHYRERADRDAYTILDEKAFGTPWEVPTNYSVLPAPNSRFFDPTPLDDPMLPKPAPQLYAYELPELPQRDPARFQPGSVNLEYVDPVTVATRLPFVTGAGQIPSPTGPPAFSLLRARRIPPVQTPWYVAELPGTIRQLSAVSSPDGSYVAHATLHEVAADLNAIRTRRRTQPAQSDGDLLTEITISPIAKEVWDAVPSSCRFRILEFDSVKEEYERTFGQPPSASELNDAPRLTLEDIVDISLTNSRVYQTQKETLYRTSLRLSLERFDYDLKFSTNGHSTSVDYTHNRDAGVTENILRVPTRRLQADKMLITGGDLLARFANSVVLTFNGPQGFAADVGSDLLFDMTQSVFQRDIRFEPLTQAERNVVYDARDFARFRKTFFFDRASEYYDLILQYRQIEIEAQNFFTIARGFEQQQAEYRAGRAPQFEVDQFEQNFLSNLRGLIGQCNTFERSLDSLKLSMGIPTETPINLDLTELIQLTQRDRQAVLGDLVGRIGRRIRAELADAETERLVLLSQSVGMIDAMLQILDLQRELNLPASDESDLMLTRLRLRVEEGVIGANTAEGDLLRETQSDSPSEITIFGRRLALNKQLLLVATRQLELAIASESDRQMLDSILMQVETLREQLDVLNSELDQILGAGESSEDDTQELVDLAQQLAPLMVRAAEIQQQAESVTDQLDQMNGVDRSLTEDELMALTVATIEALLTRAESETANLGGLVDVEISVDDAMMTALNLRFELMNERGFLADDWRAIKLAADDLKSVLNLNANQIIRTRRDVNRVLDFTFDESRTQLRLDFDLPVNRRAQRNSFREVLLNYQAGLRSLIQLEDTIKFAVRNDLRNLELDRENYRINVAAAALGSEQVKANYLQLILGLESIRAFDFLQAQATYAQRLSDVAETHINQIVDRMQLFLDLELLTVDEFGFWQEIYQEDFQPEPYYQLPPHAQPAYGTLPRVLYSHAVKRMNWVPAGLSAVHSDGIPADAEEIPAPVISDPDYIGPDEEYPPELPLPEVGN